MECRGPGGKWKSIYLIVKGKRCSTLRSNLFCQQGADMFAESRGGSGGEREGRGRPITWSPSPRSLLPSAPSHRSPYRSRIYKKTGGDPRNFLLTGEAILFTAPTFVIWCSLAGACTARNTPPCLHCEHIAPSIVAAPLISWQLCLPRDLTIKDPLSTLFRFRIASDYWV